MFGWIFTKTLQAVMVLAVVLLFPFLLYVMIEHEIEFRREKRHANRPE